MRKTLGAFALFLLVGPAHAVTSVEELNWVTEPGPQEIATGHARYTINANEFLVRGDDAAEYSRLTQGHDLYHPDAIVTRIDGPEMGTDIWIEFDSIGYVKTDDWEDTIDADELLDSIKDGTEETNRRRDKGTPAMTVDGWAEEPHLDRTDGVVYWAVSLRQGEQPLINAIALKLGRKGYTELTWVGDPSQFVNAAQSLRPVLDAYQFDEGHRYADFDPAVDAVAAVGAGALVYKMLTGTVVGKGFLVAALLFLKKFWFLVILPFVAAWRWIKGRFSSDN